MPHKKLQSTNISPKTVMPLHIELRVKEYLAPYGIDRHGLVQKMADATGLSRHTIRGIIQGKARVLSLDTLGKICGYFHELGITEGLPGALIGARPTRLIEALAAHGEVKLFVAEYRRDEFPRLWVARDDAAVLQRFSAMLLPIQGDQPTRVQTQHVATHVPPGGSGVGPATLEEDMARAQALLVEMRQDTESAAVIVGSQRANYLTECFVAELFGCDAFVPRSGQVPLYLKFQEGARSPSCFGGDDPPTGEGASAPAGIYYQPSPDAPWAFLPSDPGRRGAGGVILRRDGRIDKLEMVVFGVSAISTAAMAKIIDSQPARFWFSPLDRAGIQTAIFLCGFELLDVETGEESIDELRIGELQIITLDFSLPRSRRSRKSLAASAGSRG